MSTALPPRHAGSTADVVVIGAGAAGLLCAAQAAARGRRVVVLERNAAIGEKIRISGGGRCNFTNRIMEPERFISENPDFVRSALARFPADAFVALVERHGIPYVERESGQLFCERSAREIVAMLRDDCENAGVSIVSSCFVETVERNGNDFLVRTDSHGTFEAGAVVIATGGLSLPQLGATDFGYRIARSFGLRIVPTRPGLVPLTLDPSDLRTFGGVSGVSVDVRATVEGASFRGNLLVTHRGFSGPAILQISSYWQPPSAIGIDVLPDTDIQSLLLSPVPAGTLLPTTLSRHMPQRFARAFAESIGVAAPIDRLDRRERIRIAELIRDWSVTPSGTEGYGKAEVTVGGVDTRELSSKTMEATRAPGLFFIGEVVDVTGWLGGYNFQWAWSSGFAAGNAV